MNPNITKATSAGYIWRSESHGAFEPSAGKVDFTAEQIAGHNRLLAKAEIIALKQSGRGQLYLSEHDENGMKVYDVGPWTGPKIARCYWAKKSWHNFAGKDGRTDFRFVFDGSTWAGVLIGDTQLARVRRLKRS